jgi:hypothetical protein
VVFANWAMRFQAPIIVIGAVAPLFCLMEDMTIKLAFAALHYCCIGTVIGSIGAVNFVAFGLVIKETEKISNKDATTISSLKSMKMLKREVTSQAVQNLGLSLLFGFWPFLQVRAAWNLSIAYPLVVHVLLVPIATKMFWPKSKRKKIGPNGETVANTTVGNSAVAGDSTNASATEV